MSKANALAGLIGNYGDSDEDSDSEVNVKAVHAKRSSVLESSVHSFAGPPPQSGHAYTADVGAIHPAPIPHCPWSACYDENSGFTYYWNQQTNAVTWEAPPEYLLALKLAQQQLHTSGSTEVSAEEWQLYQQALAEKQNTQTKVISKPPAMTPVKKPNITDKKSKAPAKRRMSDDVEKIELITSYHNSDSDSNDEADTPVKPAAPAPQVAPKPPKLPKVQPKKPKTKSQPKEYGPSLPPNQNYTVPIGPEIPPEFLVEPTKEVTKSPAPVIEETEKVKSTENEDSQDESLLLTKLKDKAKLLEKLGGELPAELQEIIRDEANSKPSSPKVAPVTDSTPVGDIDDLLQEIEKKELPKVKTKTKIDIFSDEIKTTDSGKSSPRSNGTVTPPLKEEIKPLFPSSQNIVDVPTTSLFPSAVPIEENGVDKEVKETPVVAEKKGTNLYLMGAGEVIEPTRKKLRISNSVLPPKKVETPAYTTKYAQFIEGFTSERTGLGFSKNDNEEATPKDSPKNAISYGNGLMFTKGETLNEDKKDDEIEDMSDLVEAKLRFLSQLQPVPVSPIQEMIIQLQTLTAALSAGALSPGYVRRWSRAADAALRAHEAAAAPPGWRATFQRSEGRYRYEREADGLVQWEYPAADHCDMDICTTPPHPTAAHKEEPLPPLPRSPPPPPPPPTRPRTPPPPAWHDPPPPGCDEPAPQPPPPPPSEPKQEIGDELLSFYNDIAELEKHTPSAPNTAGNSPEPPPLPPLPEVREKQREKEREKEKEGKVKKKSKVKISSSIGMKQKSVSNLVAKWQQVAEEINSD